MFFGVCYDLHADRDYKQLHQELTRLGGVRVTLSHWILRQDMASTSTLTDHLSQYVDGDDVIVVMQVVDIGSNVLA